MTGLMTAGFFSFQQRAFSGAPVRIAACTLVSGVSETRKALPWGLSGPQGSGSALTSLTTTSRPPAGSSMAGSSLTQKRCWWLLASTPVFGKMCGGRQGPGGGGVVVTVSGCW